MNLYKKDTVKAHIYATGIFDHFQTFSKIFKDFRQTGTENKYENVLKRHSKSTHLCN